MKALGDIKEVLHSVSSGKSDRQMMAGESTKRSKKTGVNVGDGDSNDNISAMLLQVREINGSALEGLIETAVETGSVNHPVDEDGACQQDSNEAGMRKWLGQL